MSTPLLSVLVVTPDQCLRFRKLVRHLSAQTIASRIELVIACPHPEPPGLEELTSGPLAAVRLTPCAGAPFTMGGSRAAAVRAASAPVIAFGEDHCFPTPNWAEKFLEAQSRGWDAIGPTMCTANPGSRLSWIDITVCYGDFVNPREGPAPSIAWHNSCYRRDDLLAFGAALDNLLQADFLLQDRLRAQGKRFFLSAEAVVYHVNFSLLSAHFAGQYWGNRLFGALRSVEWPTERRLFYAAAFPAILAIRIRSAIRCARQSKVAWPATVPSLCAAVYGEASGYLFGLGNTLEKRAYYEMFRELHVRKEDVSLLSE